MRIALIAAAAPLFLLAVPAQAQGFETTASATIERGALPKAERILKNQLRQRGEQPELLINLASIYARTGRDAEARALYRRVLDQQDVPMDLSSGAAAGSHAIARAGLKRLGALTTASTN